MLKNGGWFKSHGWPSAGLLVLAAIVISLVNYEVSDRSWAWLITVALLVGIFMLVGAMVTGRYAGVLIDSRNRISFSRFQAAGWTVIVGSAIATEVGRRLVTTAEAADAVNFLIPQNLLIAVGLSAASLAAAPMVLSATKTSGQSGATRRTTWQAPAGSARADHRFHPPGPGNAGPGERRRK